MQDISDERWRLLDYQRDRRVKLCDAARKRKRVAGTNLQCNGDMSHAEVCQYCAIDESSKSLLRARVQQIQLNACEYHCILKIARTIADLAGRGKSVTPQQAEAIQYRRRKQ